MSLLIVRSATIKVNEYIWYAMIEGVSDWSRNMQELIRYQWMTVLQLHR